jgi:hypothetical protein
MSKYDPLNRYLAASEGGHMPMDFREVERLLGFPLPPSARQHASWWSNNPGTHVGVKAWRDAGWRTSRVDLGAERVTFVREAHRSTDEKPSLANPAMTETVNQIAIDSSALANGAIHLLEAYSEEHHCSLSEAAVGVLNALALERRRQLIEWFRANSPRVPGDSTDIIREARDAR